MSVKIRLAVTGKKNQIAYRIVASDTRSKRDGKFLEILGFYNPTSNAAEKLRFEKDKIEAWVKKGATLTPSVAYLIEKGTLERPKKPKVKKEDVPQVSPAPTPAQTPTKSEKSEESESSDTPTVQPPESSDPSESSNLSDKPKGEK